MSDKPTRILETNQASGLFPRVASGTHILAVAGHAGGVWTVDLLFPVQIGGADVWIPTNITFDKNDAVAIALSNAFKYRISGGVMGAQAFLGLIERR